MTTLSEEEKVRLLSVIHKNVFTDDTCDQFDNPLAKQLLGFYTNFRKDIITPGTELYEYKQMYDQNPTIKLRKNH